MGRGLGWSLEFELFLWRVKGLQFRIRIHGIGLGLKVKLGKTHSKQEGKHKMNISLHTNMLKRKRKLAHMER